MIEDIYQEHILEHYECPYHKGHLPHPTCKHREKNPICGDVIELELLVDDRGRVVEAWFSGTGCAISQAAASMLCRDIEGKTLEEIEEMQPQQMLDLIGVPLTASRQKCGLLGFKVLKTILYSRNRETQPAVAN